MRIMHLVFTPKFCKTGLRQNLLQLITGGTGEFKYRSVKCINSTSTNYR